MGDHRFKLSCMVPHAWLHKLKDMAGSKQPAKNSNHHTISNPPLPPPPPPTAILPNRPSHYFSPRNPKSADPGVAGDDELYRTLRRLPPIATRPRAAAGDAGRPAASPPGRHRLRGTAGTPKAGGGRRRAGSVAVVVKASEDPRRDFEESVREMAAERGVRGERELQELLACYLALNAGEHHRTIVEVFRRVWADRCLANICREVW